MHQVPPTLLAMAAMAMLAYPGLTDADARPRATEPACAQAIHVSSRGAPLSHTLRQMSLQYGFDLHYWTQDDPPLHLEMQRPVREVMAAVSDRSNVMVQYRRDPRCRGAYRIAAVWVLPTGAANRLPAPAHAVAPVSGPASESEGYAAYLRAHGVISPPPPATAPARP